MTLVLPIHFVGTTREHYLLPFGAAGSIALCAGLVGSWIGAYLGARRAVRTSQLAETQREATVGGSEIAQLAQALDAVALEVERISEGQRFTTRLLTERQAGPIVERIQHKSITPH